MIFNITISIIVIILAVGHAHWLYIISKRLVELKESQAYLLGRINGLQSKVELLRPWTGKVQL